jgi:hypothetical protein
LYLSSFLHSCFFLSSPAPDLMNASSQEVLFRDKLELVSLTAPKGLLDCNLEEVLRTGSRSVTAESLASATSALFDSAKAIWGARSTQLPEAAFDYDDEMHAHITSAVIAAVSDWSTRVLELGLVDATVSAAIAAIARVWKSSSGLPSVLPRSLSRAEYLCYFVAEACVFIAHLLEALTLARHFGVRLSCAPAGQRFPSAGTGWRFNVYPIGSGGVSEVVSLGVMVQGPSDAAVGAATRFSTPVLAVSAAYVAPPAAALGGGGLDIMAMAACALSEIEPPAAKLMIRGPIRNPHRSGASAHVEGFGASLLSGASFPPQGCGILAPAPATDTSALVRAADPQGYSQLSRLRPPMSRSPVVISDDSDDERPAPPSYVTRPARSMSPPTADRKRKRGVGTAAPATVDELRSAGITACHFGRAHAEALLAKTVSKNDRRWRTIADYAAAVLIEGEKGRMRVADLFEAASEGTLGVFVEPSQAIASIRSGSDSATLQFVSFLGDHAIFGAERVFLAARVVLLAAAVALSRGCSLSAQYADGRTITLHRQLAKDLSQL